MSKIIKIISKNLEFFIELNDSKTSQKILRKIPLSSTARRWGDEIYFQIPVQTELENSVEILSVGSVAFWPPGSAFCIFFGKTPASTGADPQAASPVTIIGKILKSEDILKLKEISDGDTIELKTK